MLSLTFPISGNSVLVSVPCPHWIPRPDAPSPLVPEIPRQYVSISKYESRQYNVNLQKRGYSRTLDYETLE